MPVSVFELFRPGVGPSSSHTVGPMRIGLRFARELAARGLLPRVAWVEADLYGSLALTGRGHGTDRAVVMGLMGLDPATVDPHAVAAEVEAVRRCGRLPLAGAHAVDFDESHHLHFHVTEQLPEHPNGMRLHAFDAQGQELLAQTMFSIGGGFVADARELAQPARAGAAWPHPYRSGAELLQRCAAGGLTIAQLALENERALRPRGEVDAGLDALRAAMLDCIARGLRAEGTLPGVLKVRRRARELWFGLQQARGGISPALEEMRCASAFAIAVNEENAAGGRVVTAPTNGAAGIVPAVLRYYEEFCREATQEGSRAFLLAAAAIGSLYKENASISGAEVGCQGEVGVACSMAAAGLAAALGGRNAQVENAAEIAMEHHLGLTCDPVAGLVQIPCIERNAMGAVKAINAAGLALSGDGVHHVTLDGVIETMRQTGADMSSKYKETALGGLAVNVVAC